MNQKITHTDGQLIKMLETMRQKEATPEAIQAILQEGIFAAVVDPYLNRERAKLGLGITKRCIGPIANVFHFPGSEEVSARKMIKISIDRRYDDEFLKVFSDMTCLKSEARNIYSYRLNEGFNTQQDIGKELEPYGVLSLSEMFWVLNNKEIQERYNDYLCFTRDKEGGRVVVRVQTREHDSSQRCFKVKLSEGTMYSERLLVLARKNGEWSPLDTILDP